jgi:PAS domain S-box-containing protein
LGVTEFSGVWAYNPITERKRVKDHLRDSEEYLRLAVEGGQMGTWEWDTRRDRSRWNAREYELLGLPVGGGEIATAAFFERVHSEDGAELRAKIGSVLEAGEDFSHEFRIVRPDGEVRWLAGKGQVIRDRGGEPARMIGVNFDITERRRAEEALKEADRRKNEFLAMLSHELRNPLAPIRAAVQVMRKLDMTDPRQYWARDVVDRQMNQLTRLVDDLLDVSRIVQGKLTLKRALLDLIAVIEQAVEAARPVMEGRRHTLTVSVPHSSIRLDGDAVRLIQVFSNLLDNAAKYTPEGGGVWLTATLAGGEVAVSVRDTGEGITGGLLPYLFDIFTQAERSLDRSQGGLGLGLTIVQKIVEMHGGRIEAKSEGLGKGSEFIVRLPIHELS